jgi:hypothetical protein
MQPVRCPRYATAKTHPLQTKGDRREPIPFPTFGLAPSVISRHNPETGIEQPLNDDRSRVDGVEDHCREIVGAEQIGQDVARVQLSHAN